MTFFSTLFSAPRRGSSSRAVNIDSSFQAIQEQLEAQSSEILEGWQRDMEGKMGETVSSLMNGMLDSLGSQMGARTPAPRIDFGSLLGTSGNLDRALRPFETQVNQWMRVTVNEWFSSEKTVVNQTQSARSREVLENFRESRSQQQSQAAREAKQGQRNL